MFELSAGQIVADKYRIDGVVGRGGMGVVVAATHLELDQKVAIKLLRDVSPESLARFQREARLLVRLKSPHVARVFDVGALDDDTPFIVMELLEGEDLGAVQAARGRVDVEQAVDWVLDAACAVAEAHTMGMVHRDLKPANLFLARGPGGTSVVKVLDFGVSKQLEERALGADAPAGDLTNEGVALGSPGYMSPEQLTSSRDVDARADVFSLGAILYRLVSGEAPYKGDSVVSALASMAVDRFRPLSEIAPVPPELGAVVDRALVHDREQRWPTVAHFARALAPFASRRGKKSVDEILATMHVASAEGPLGQTRVQPISAPPAIPRAAESSTVPFGAEATKRASAWPAVVAACTVGAVTLAAVVLIARERVKRVAAPSVSATASASAGEAIPSGDSIVTSAAVPAPPPPSVTAEPSVTASARPRPSHPRVGPPRSATRPSDAPPSPTEVPPSRH